MNCFGAESSRPDALPGVNHMHGMQYKIFQNSGWNSTNTVVQICVHNSYTKEQY